MIKACARPLVPRTSKKIATNDSQISFGDDGAFDYAFETENNNKFRLVIEFRLQSIHSSSNRFCGLKFADAIKWPDEPTRYASMQ